MHARKEATLFVMHRIGVILYSSAWSTGGFLVEGVIRQLRAAQRFCALSPQKRRTFFAALPVVLAVRVGLSITSINRVRSVASRLARQSTRLPTPTTNHAERIAWAVFSAARFVPRASCLTQAIAAEVLLVRAGHAAEVRLGVARDPSGRIGAHAWVESSGRVIIGDEDLDRYTRLEPSLTPPAPRSP